MQMHNAAVYSARIKSLIKKELEESTNPNKSVHVWCTDIYDLFLSSVRM